MTKLSELSVLIGGVESTRKKEVAGSNEVRSAAVDTCRVSADCKRLLSARYRSLSIVQDYCIIMCSSIHALVCVSVLTGSETCSVERDARRGS